jgi:hypothetical protein
MKTVLLLAASCTLACATAAPPPPAATAAAAPAPATAATAAPAPAAATAAPPGARAPDAILADAIKATGGTAAWNAHRNIHLKLEMSFQGMGISGAGDRFATKTDKSLMVTELPGIGKIREGSNSKVFWSQDPVNGLRILDGVEAEQAREESIWDADERVHELYPKIESKLEPRPEGGPPLECLVLTPRLGPPVTNCYDPATHLQVTQKGSHATPQGDTPFTSTMSDWREVGGVKMAFAVQTQAGPITFTGNITGVSFDEPLDDKMFEPPAPTGK